VATQPKKSRRRALQITGAVVLILLLLLAMGLCAVIANRPTVAVNPSIVAAGGSVIVTASHVPANQVGEIQLHSEVQVFVFRATSNGTVEEEITIPENTDVGMHVVRLCWEASCRAQANLRVVAPGTILPTPAGASPTPSPSVSPSPGLTPTPRRSTPGPSARPTSNPTSNPTRSPSPSPKPSPKPSPIPTPSPTPVPTPNPYITVSPSCGKAGASVTVSGFYFTPGQAENIDFRQGLTTTRVFTGAVVASNGKFAKPITVPALALPGSATIRVTGSDGVFTAAFTVPPLLGSC